MDRHTATECAYKNGYAAGMKAAERRGRWIPVPNTGIGATGRCTVCNKAIYGFAAFNYCPNCGARMDLEVSE